MYNILKKKKKCIQYVALSFKRTLEIHDRVKANNNNKKSISWSVCMNTAKLKENNN